LPWRTVRQNVELVAELHGFGRAERRRVAQQAIDAVGLSGFEDHYPRSLSGGMRMRASLARTLTLEPPLLLFDEPFGSLDEITRERLNSETQRLHQAQGFTGLFVTHSINEAVFLGTRVVVMSPRPGRIVAEIAVPLGYPRTPEMRFDPEFARLSSLVATSLREATG
jgi:NitT/TauT family transport system ATP-binding protein